MKELTLNERHALAMGWTRREHHCGWVYVSPDGTSGELDAIELPDIEIPEGEVPDEVIGNNDRLVDLAVANIGAEAFMERLGRHPLCRGDVFLAALSLGHLQARQDVAFEVLEC